MDLQYYLYIFYLKLFVLACFSVCKINGKFCDCSVLFKRNRKEYEKKLMKFFVIAISLVLFAGCNDAIKLDSEKPSDSKGQKYGSY